MLFPVKNLHTMDTVYPADSIEWCNHPDYKNYFVCGTYQLEKSDETESSGTDVHSSLEEATTNRVQQKRSGYVYGYEFHPENHKSLREIQCIQTEAGVLDMKWLPNPKLIDQCPRLVIANALGQVEIFELNTERSLHRIEKLELKDCPEDNLLALSLDVQLSGDDDSHQSYKLIVSDSKGGLHLLTSIGEHSTQLKRIHKWSAHDFEAWTCAFDRYNENLVFSGGDDTLIKIYDIRMKSCTLTNRSHGAGVTSLLSHPGKEYCLLTGSYDEELRVFDTRHFKQPVTQLNLGGGIWRLKLAPQNRNLILAACMYHNFSVISFNPKDTAKGLSLSAVISTHESICYGADWCPHIGGVSSTCNSNRQELFMATGSFYDHRMCLSMIEYEDE